MKLSTVWILPALPLLLSGFAFGEGTGTAGIVKGAITIGGSPTSDVVVSIEGIAPKYFKSTIPKSGSRRAVMDQQELKFIPHVLPVLVGTAVNFLNHDKSWHNIFSVSDTKKFDLGLYPPGKSRSVIFDKPGIARILCNVHPTMEAFIVVKSHPYFSAADKEGNYRVNSVPLGRYRLVVWHPELGTREVSFELAREGEVLDINVDLKSQR
jgi:plastocyanin